MTLGRRRSAVAELEVDGALQGDALHDRIVNEVARARFGLDGWNVTTNGVSSGEKTGDVDVPDVIATSDSRIVAIGEVETLETISDKRALRWQSFGESCVRFYLYIPDGAEDEAIRLIRKHGVHCAGLRSYSLNGKLDLRQVRLTNVPLTDDDHPWWLTLGGCDNA